MAISMASLKAGRKCSNVISVNGMVLKGVLYGLKSGFIAVYLSLVVGNN
jgi:hypothetical protein